MNVSPFPQTTYSTLANGMPILNSLPNAPAAIYIDFDGGVYHGSTTVDPYDVDGNSATFNTTEQETIAEAWREMSVYFAMFNVNVTTVQPNKPVAWLLVGNNISGGQSYVNVFPDSRPESRNQSSDARTRVSGLAHEIGHNFGNQHTANYDNLGNKTSEYHGAFDPLHGPIMGIDYAGIIHKWTTWHNRNGATVLQDDMAVITADLDNYGGDGYRTDDFGGSIATAAALTTIGTTQASVGIIERLTDVDMFSFASVGGTYSILVGRDNPSGVDVKVSVLDATGACARPRGRRSALRSVYDGQRQSHDLGAARGHVLRQGRESRQLRRSGTVRRARRSPGRRLAGRRRRAQWRAWLFQLRRVDRNVQRGRLGHRHRRHRGRLSVFVPISRRQRFHHRPRR